MIVIADDLGRDAMRNGAIARAFGEGLVTAASLMANMPGFEEACTIARGHGLPVGAHLVLTDGEPLTGAIRRIRPFCDDSGRFVKWRRAGERAFQLGPEARRAVADELRAQVARIREAGLEPGHLDSHHHVHNELGIGRVVIALAQELGVPRVRLARNCGPGIRPWHRLYKAYFNGLIRRAGVAGTRWFGGLEDYRTLRPAQLARFELMVHPILGDGLLADEDFPARSLADLLA